jgi:hypothetical protein
MKNNFSAHRNKLSEETRNKEQGTRNKEQGRRKKEEGTRNTEHKIKNQQTLLNGSFSSVANRSRAGGRREAVLATSIPERLGTFTTPLSTPFSSLPTASLKFGSKEKQNKKLI